MNISLTLKCLVCLILLTGLSQTVNANDYDEVPKYHLGVRLGYSETNVWHDLHLDGHSDRNCQSFMVGVAFDEKFIRKPLYIETGLYVSNRGVDVRDGSRRYAEDNFSVMVPALISYHFHPTTDFGIAPFGGPFMAYNFGFEKMDYGLRMGFGINYKQIVANFGFDFGLRDNMFHNEDGWMPNDGLLTSFFVTLGWNFLGNM